MFKDTMEIEKLKNERELIADRESRLRAMVIAVRLAQVEYFATRSKESLVKSKSAESRLDKELFGKTLTKGDLQDLGEKHARDYSTTTETGRSVSRG